MTKTKDTLPPPPKPAPPPPPRRLREAELDEPELDEAEDQLHEEHEPELPLEPEAPVRHPAHVLQRDAEFEAGRRALATLGDRTKAEHEVGRLTQLAHQEAQAVAQAKGKKTNSRE